MNKAIMPSKPYVVKALLRACRIHVVMCRWEDELLNKFLN
jgi:hypothetical protein